MNENSVDSPIIRNGRNYEKAQAAVEFALILPVVLLLVFTIIEIARMAQAWLVVTNSARVGLRYAVTGVYDSAHCSSEIDINGNDLFCEQEPDKENRIDEIDAARLLTIYKETEDSAVGIMKDLSVTDKNVPGYFHVTVCSTNREPEPDGEIRVYHPPPEDYCSPFDHPGDPSTGPARALVAVTFEHPVILPILNQIAPSVTLHAERTGIVEQFRIARVLGLPPMIAAPSATPPPTATNTTTNTATNTATSTVTHTATNTATNTLTPTRTSTPDPNASPTSTRTVTPTDTPTRTATRTPTRTITHTSSNTPIPSDTPTPSTTPTPSDTPTPSRTPLVPPSETPTELPPTKTPWPTLPGGG